MGFYVPETMQKMNNWLVQRDKVPYSPKTGRIASPTDRSQWGSYQEAVDRLKFGDSFHGLGFAFSESDNLVFIDLDHCIDEYGEITEAAANIISLFPDTYTEISKSETGLHIVCKGRISRSFRRNDIGLEVYSSGRYMAFTGNAISPTEPQEAQEALDSIFTLYAPKKPVEATQKPASGKYSLLSAEDVIQAIQSSKQGAKFDRLFSGDFSEYPSQSEADQAFINIVNHFSGSNESLILAIWQQSKLSERKKGARPDYISRMISNARETHTSATVSRRRARKPSGGEIGSGNKKRIRTVKR